jgi:hypothetical protein
LRRLELGGLLGRGQLGGLLRGLLGGIISSATALNLTLPLSKEGILQASTSTQFFLVIAHDH